MFNKNKNAYVGLFRIAIIVLIILLIIAAFIAYSVWFSTAKAAALSQEEIDNAKIKKAYLWLESKSLGKWGLLTTEQHVFSFIALKNNLAQTNIDSSKNSLFSKANNKLCWPKQNCNIKETALAKLMLNSETISYDTENISNWLMLQNQSISGIEWQFQITPTEIGAIQCTISYNGNNYPILIDEKNRFLNGAGNCLTIYNDYWLKLSGSCDNIKMNLSCNDSAISNFLLKKGNDFYVIDNNIDLSPETITPIGIDSYCLANPSGECNYEGTLWAAYSFAVNNEENNAKFLLPYLIILSDENEKYFPEAFLYSITKRESYSIELDNIKGTSSLITLSPSAYNPYYDSALAGFLTNSNSMLQMNDYILTKQSFNGYWESVSGDSQRETALILLGFFGGFQTRSECEINGLSCVSNCSLYGGTLSGSYSCESGECCQINFNCEDKNGECKANCLTNETQTDYSCSSGGGVCCKPLILSSCISEIKGKICSVNQQCLDSYNNSLDFTNSVDSMCCEGNCYELPLRTCSELYGSVCSPDENKSCLNDDWFPSSQTTDQFCCRNSCQQGLDLCSNYGGEICNSSYSCSGAEPMPALDTNGQSTCCVGKCVPNKCEDVQGNPCMGDEQCSGQQIESYDSLKCCIGGSCLNSCSKLGGDPCPSKTKSCEGELKESFDYSDCCVGTCKEKGKFPWIILIIILGAMIIAALIIFRKKLFKKKERPNNILSKPNLPRGAQPMQMPVQGIQGMQRPSLQRPSLIPPKLKK